MLNRIAIRTIGIIYALYMLNPCLSAAGPYSPMANEAIILQCIKNLTNTGAWLLSDEYQEWKRNYADKAKVNDEIGNDGLSHRNLDDGTPGWLIHRDLEIQAMNAFLDDATDRMTGNDLIILNETLVHMRRSSVLAEMNEHFGTQVALSYVEKYVDECGLATDANLDLIVSYRNSINAIVDSWIESYGHLIKMILEGVDERELSERKILTMVKVVSESNKKMMRGLLQRDHDGAMNECLKKYACDLKREMCGNGPVTYLMNAIKVQIHVNAPDAKEEIEEMQSRYNREMEMVECQLLEEYLDWTTAENQKIVNREYNELMELGRQPMEAWKSNPCMRILRRIQDIERRYLIEIENYVRGKEDLSSISERIEVVIKSVRNMQ